MNVTDTLLGILGGFSGGGFAILAFFAGSATTIMTCQSILKPLPNASPGERTGAPIMIAVLGTIVTVGCFLASVLLFPKVSPPLEYPIAWLAGVLTLLVLLLRWYYGFVKKSNPAKGA